LPSPESALAPSPEPASLRDFDWHYLVEPDLWSEVPKDVDELLGLLPSSDLYVQDEVDVRLHPTLHQVWSRKGSRGQRLVRAPGTSRRFVGFGAFDWRDGFLSIGYGLHRSADVFCLQLDHLVARSQARGRKAIVLLDNLGIHTAEGSRLLRETLKKHEGKFRLVYTPPYDPEANPSERLWPRFRLAVTHNHHRDEIVSLYQDTLGYFDRLDAEPNRVLRHLGSPYALLDDRDDDTKLSPDKALTREEATAA
jgi:transposase